MSGHGDPPLTPAVISSDTHRKPDTATVGNEHRDRWGCASRFDSGTMLLERSEGVHPNLEAEAMRHLLFLAVGVPVMVALLGYGIGPMLEWVLEVVG